jgi:DNA invertase Pin-like site-specific DNA recombinase
MGVEAARRRGARIGRPNAAGWDDGKAKSWAAEGISAAEIGRRLGVSDRTVRRHLGPGEKGTPLAAA